ncbi:uncharacterized protein LOC130107851 [Lampris incognitus]|uniref:uncharacterized protein LOC130107851 n=1 Tax=Lampris incognitus TaxID=2546036 RepID=UPI0024B4E333|nr:uncharacterized protein LOC130107851 [Lampris incognitus]
MESSATGLSPFECSLGYQPPLFPHQELEVAVPSTRAHLRRCRRVWKTARAAMLQATERARRSANRRRVPAPAYRPGQRVWLLARDLPLPTLNRKLAPRYVGPYTIDRIVNPSAVRLHLPTSLKIHPVFHVSRLKPVATSPVSPPVQAPPPPRVLDGGDMVWDVDQLLAVRRRGRGYQYLVDWVGYGPEDRSWVPRSYLADPALLEEFYRAHPNAIGRSPGVFRRRGGPVVVTPPRAAAPARSSHSPSSDEPETSERSRSETSAALHQVFAIIHQAHLWQSGSLLQEASQNVSQCFDVLNPAVKF